jgi:hypothetical protein
MNSSDGLAWSINTLTWPTTKIENTQGFALKA